MKSPVSRIKTVNEKIQEVVDDSKDETDNAVIEPLQLKEMLSDIGVPEERVQMVEPVYEKVCGTAPLTAANLVESKTVLAAMIGGKVLVMVNPVITGHSAKSYETEEGCLSLTGVRPTKRYNIITVEYKDKSFKKKKAIFRDFEAQIIQHEIDHFEGILI